METLKNKVERFYKEVLSLDISDEELNKCVIDIKKQTKSELSKIPGFNEAKLEIYFRRENGIVFSPRTLHNWIIQIVKKIGIEELERSHKYKRLSEVNDASCLALALKKLFNEEWMIKSQDSPDTLLVKRNTDDWSKKFLNVIALEIMRIPEQAKKSFGSDIENDIAEFIKEKKFNKRYEGIPHLLIHLDFNH